MTTRTIYCMCGLSGAGKTYGRTHDPNLKDLPALDIADLYNKNPALKPDEALQMFVDEIIGVCETKTPALVLEAYFRPHSQQRKWGEWVAENQGYEVVYIELDATKSMHEERIRVQYVAECSCGCVAAL